MDRAHLFSNAKYIREKVLTAVCSHVSLYSSYFKTVALGSCGNTTHVWFACFLAHDSQI